MFLGAPTIILSAARLLLLCSNNNTSTKLMMMLNIRIAFFIMEDPSCSSSTTLLKTNPTLQDLLNKTYEGKTSNRLDLQKPSEDPISLSLLSPRGTKP
jgi:hypothetical protein